MWPPRDPLYVKLSYNSNSLSPIIIINQLSVRILIEYEPNSLRDKETHLSWNIIQPIQGNLSLDMKTRNSNSITIPIITVYKYLSPQRRGGRGSLLIQDQRFNTIKLLFRVKSEERALSGLFIRIKDKIGWTSLVVVYLFHVLSIF